MRQVDPEAAQGMLTVKVSQVRWPLELLAKLATADSSHTHQES